MAEVGFGIPAEKKPARGVRFNHWGAANCGLQLGENLTSLYAARPPQRAARIGALINFIGSSCTAVSVFVQWPPVISAVSLYRRGRSDYEYFYA
jgi:hypothetical protein